MSRKVTGCRVYWDSQDPQNEGWAYNVYYSDGHEESGPWEWNLDENAELCAAVVQLAHEYGVEITTDVVTCEPNVDGGYATWRSE